MKKRGETGSGPKKASVQEKIITLGFSNVQYFVVRQRAQMAGKKVVVYIRQMAVEGQVIARITPEEIGLFKQLVQISNGIQQLADKAQKDGATETMLYFIKYGDMIDSFINRFSHDQ